MRLMPDRARLALLGGLTVAAVLVPSAASAHTKGVTLNGDWAPFNRCPVDAPAMLSADGVTNTADCVASSSPSGTIKIGNLTVAGGQSSLQFGLINNTSTGFSIVAPQSGAIASAPAQIPGGLAALLCPSSNPHIATLCRHLAHSKLNNVKATIESAGSPSNFSLLGGLSAGTPIVTLPVKLVLSNPLLGRNCSIGTNSDPIVLHPENAAAPTVQAENFDGNGTPDSSGVMLAIFSTGQTQTDTTFSVPGATGCGPFGLGDAIINQKVGLPSASGNSLTLTNASAYLGGLATPAAAAPNDGKDLSSYWHSAVTG